MIRFRVRIQCNPKQATDPGGNFYSKNPVHEFFPLLCEYKTDPGSCYSA